MCFLIFGRPLKQIQEWGLSIATFFPCAKIITSSANEPTEDRRKEADRLLKDELLGGSETLIFMVTFIGNIWENIGI